MPFPAVHPALDRALAARGYAEPTPVQLAVVEADKDNADLLVSAQTGSGKTVAFGLAHGADLLDGGKRLDHAGAPLALVIAPTRELALQVSARADMALRRSRRIRRDLRRRHGPAHGASGRSNAAPISSSVRRAACATTSRAARSTCPPPASSCSTKPTRCSTSASAKISNSSSTPRRSKTAAP
jgi:superfamily II DNA/RNA helicase